METLAENKFGHGAIDKRIDLRDDKFPNLGGAVKPFDWITGIDAPDQANTKDQDQSFSCGGQAGSYLNAKLVLNRTGHYIEQSAKSIYSLIFYPQGGTTLRDILETIVNRGVNLESDILSYPANESNLTNRTWVTTALTAEANTRKGLRYAFVQPNIESVAEAIRDTGGCIIQISGQNNGTWLSAKPIKPSSNTNLWSHFLYAGRAKLIDGAKHIGVHNSWGNSVGEQGWQWISEDYFKSGFVTDAGVVYEPAPDVDPSVKAKKILILQTLIKLYYALLDAMTK